MGRVAPSVGGYWVNEGCHDLLGSVVPESLPLPRRGWHISARMGGKLRRNTHHSSAHGWSCRETSHPTWSKGSPNFTIRTAIANLEDNSANSLDSIDKCMRMIEQSSIFKRDCQRIKLRNPVNVDRVLPNVRYRRDDGVHLSRTQGHGCTGLKGPPTVV